MLPFCRFLFVPLLFEWFFPGFPSELLGFFPRFRPFFRPKRLGPLAASQWNRSCHEGRSCDHSPSLGGLGWLGGGLGGGWLVWRGWLVGGVGWFGVGLLVFLVVFEGGLGAGWVFSVVVFLNKGFCFLGEVG